MQKYSIQSLNIYETIEKKNLNESVFFLLHLVIPDLLVIRKAPVRCSFYSTIVDGIKTI